MTFLYVLLGILLLTGLALFSNLKIKIIYDGEFKIKFYLGFIRIIIPTKSEDKKKKSKNSKKSKSKENNNKKDENGFFKSIKTKGFVETFDYIIDSIRPIIKILKIFSSHIRIDPLELKIVLVGDDAATLAINYGRVCSVVYPFISSITTKFKTKNLKSNISVDYTKKEMDLFIYLVIKFRLIYGLKYIILLIKEIINLKTMFKQERK